MKTVQKNFAMIGAILMGLGVAAGAFGAHSLAPVIDLHNLRIFEKGVLYQLIHAGAILVVASMIQNGMVAPLNGGRICKIFAGGILFFSGSLYLLVISGIREFGAVTPIGGTLFILGWIYTALSLRDLKSN